MSLGRLAGRRSRQKLHLEENLPSIQADAGLLRRALDNLILNAMDAMPGGGVLMLRTSERRRHCGTGSFRHWNWIDAAGMRAFVQSLLHYEAARHRVGPGDRAGGGQQSRRAHFGGKRSGRGYIVSHPPACKAVATHNYAANHSGRARECSGCARIGRLILSSRLAGTASASAARPQFRLTIAVILYRYYGQALILSGRAGNRFAVDGRAEGTFQQHMHGEIGDEDHE